MRVYVEAVVYQIRNGVAAHDAQTRLTGHGRDEESALDSLQRGVTAWVRSLDRGGYLEGAIKRNGVRVEHDGDDLSVIVRAAAPAPAPEEARRG